MKPFFKFGYSTVLLVSSVACGTSYYDKKPEEAKKHGYYVSAEDAKERGGVGNFVPREPDPEAESREKAATAAPAFQPGQVAGTYYFPLGSAQVNPEDQKKIEELAARVKADPNAKFTVEGYADSVGTEKINESLSAKRADTVAGLMEQGGVSEGQVQERHFGDRLASSEERVENPEDRKVIIRAG